MLLKMEIHIGIKTPKGNKKPFQIDDQKLQMNITQTQRCILNGNFLKTCFVGFCSIHLLQFVPGWPSCHTGVRIRPPPGPRPTRQEVEWQEGPGDPRQGGAASGHSGPS